MDNSFDQLCKEVRAAAQPLDSGRDQYDRLLGLIGEARLVLIGEATHGTHEFYKERAEITKRLIREKGFCAVVTEADWPDAYRVHRYVQGHDADPEAAEALSGFQRFPAWMWRNADVLDFVDWLRAHNDGLPRDAPRAGFYGMDLYSLRRSIEAVLSYLDKADPQAARGARERYACFDHRAEDTETYGYLSTLGLAPSCQAAVIAQLVELREHAAEYLRRDGLIAEDELFSAQQNALLVKNAEQYYRAMFADRVSSWNVRDRHMADTLDALLQHLGRRQVAKLVVWAHNSHLGDARATELGQAGELNVGQLMRQRHGAEAFLLGFTTYHGTVTAADDWGGPALRKGVLPGLDGSYEDLLHRVGVQRFLLPLLRGGITWHGPRLERAIGVVYKPQTERMSHYFEAVLHRQFDAVIHIDHTRALAPLEAVSLKGGGEPPETFPSAM